MDVCVCVCTRARAYPSKLLNYHNPLCQTAQLRYCASCQWYGNVQTNVREWSEGSIGERRGVA